MADKISKKNSSKKLNNNLAILWLFNCYFWKTKIGPIFSLCFPLLFMIIYFVISNNNERNTSFLTGFASYLSFCIFPLSLITLPAMNIELRNSIILRKIKTSNISKLTYNILIFSFFTFYCLVFCLAIILLTCLFSVKNISQFNVVNWPSLIYGIILQILSSVSLGLLLSSFIKSYLTSQLIGIAIMLITLLISGQFIPLQVIGSVNALKYIGLLSPLSYSANILNIAVNPTINGYVNSVFNFSQSFYISGFSETISNTNNIEIYYFWQKILFVFMPVIISIISEIISIKTFKWTNR